MSLKSWTLTNTSGDSATILNYGARLINWSVACAGDDRNLVLAYPSPEDYLQDPAFLGAIAGPFANRIGQSQFLINEHQYRLVANEGRNHLHGSIEGFEKVYWDGEQPNDSTLVLTLSQPELENGYPGNREFVVIYSLDNDGEMTIKFEGTTDKATVMGPTGHAYFNLAATGDTREHTLVLNADTYTEKDSEQIPTGKILTVDGTDMDFRETKTVPNTLDDNFVVATCDDWYQATLYCPDDALALSVYSDYPGIQVYSGHTQSEELGGQQGICLESQFFPDSPNQPHFPFCMTTPEMPLKRFIRYKVAKNA